MSWLITPQQKNKGFLDVFPGAYVAYSLRNLTMTRDEPVVRIRRSSDSAEQDFRASQILDGALVSFCGSGDGFVRTWYDQTGNNRHLENGTTSTQPRLVIGGIVNTENSKPAILFSATTNTLVVFFNYSTSSNSLFQVCKITGPGSGIRRPAFLVSEAMVLRRSGGGFYEVYGTGLGPTITTAVTFPGTQRLLSYITLHTLGDLFAYSNGVLIVSNLTGPGATANPGALFIGSSTEGLIGSMQEVILYSSDKSNQLTSIEQSINSHYLIY